MIKENFKNTMRQLGIYYNKNKLTSTILINSLKPYYKRLTNKKVKYKFSIVRLVSLLKKDNLKLVDILSLKEFIPLLE